MRWCETKPTQYCHQTTWNTPFAACSSTITPYNIIRRYKCVYDHLQIIITWRCKWKRCNWKLVEMISTCFFFHRHRRMYVVCTWVNGGQSAHIIISHLWSINNFFLVIRFFLWVKIFTNLGQFYFSMLFFHW